jgi:hypothetical protein
VFRPELAWLGKDPETGARYVAAGTADQFAAPGDQRLAIPPL